MADNSQLGIYWGETGIFFIDSISLSPSKIFDISFTSDIDGSLEGGAMGPSGMEIVSLIQNTLHHQNFHPNTANLSLSTKDIIFRSFLIPWMHASEIKGVVEFEARKYIPFDLEELTYNYHPITVTENETKQLHIIFVAIKKQLLDNYSKILEQAGITIEYIEPSILSLIRALHSKEVLPTDETVALIEHNDTTAKISVIDKLIPHFVREFNTEPVKIDKNELTEERLFLNFSNELRVSLEYINRQTTELEIKSIFFISNTDQKNLVQFLEENLNLPVTQVNGSSILGSQKFSEIRYINSYGCSLINSIELPCSFNFSSTKPKVVQKSAPKNTSKNLNIKSILKSAAISIAIIMLGFLSTFPFVGKSTNQLNTLKSKLDIDVDSTDDYLKSILYRYESELKYIKSLDFNTEIAYFLVHLVKTLPDGIWIDQLDIEYPDHQLFIDKTKKTKQKRSSTSSKTDLITEPSINVKGYAFSPNDKEQFRMVNRYFRNLKSNPMLNSSFKNIQLETTEISNLVGHEVTFFEIFLN